MLLRACPDSVAIPEGWIVRHRDLPLVQHLNTIRLREALDGERLVALADRWQSELPYRRVAIEADTGLDPAEEALLSAGGWSRERVVMMELAAGAAAAALPCDPRAREVDEATLRALEHELFSESNAGARADPRLPAQLSDAQARLRAATETRRFAAGEDGELHAMATLFCDPDVDGVRVAQLESVATRATRRERGLAGAAVVAALGAAREWAAEHVVVVADAEDWPQVWYASLGFVAVARQVAFHRRAYA